jgi:hypothetical protein
MEERTTPATWSEVTDAVKARLLSDPAALHYLKPFLGREQTVSAAAREMGCSLATMLYRVRTFLGAGLLAVIREQKRAGRPIKYYRTVADGFFIPFALTPYTDLEALLSSVDSERQQIFVRTVAQLLREAGIEGRRIYRKGDEIHSEAAPSLEGGLDFQHPSLRHGLDVSSELTLTRESAAALNQELRALLERYKGQVSDGNPYLLSLMLLPLIGLSNQS